MKSNRLFGIIYLLLSHGMMTAKELSEYFEVSTRTIYRDIESLSELNIPIYMSKGKNGGISLLDHYKLDKALLSDQEQNQILFSLQGMNQLKINHDEVYEKLKTIFSKDDENWFEVDFSVWGQSRTHQKNFELIKKSIIHKNIITFSYFNSRGIHSKRQVEPLKLYFKFNSWYLCAYDIDKKDYRFFKMMRMKDVDILDQTFERSLNLHTELKDYSIKTVSLVLQIDKKMAYRVYDEFEESSIQMQDNGDFIVSVTLPLNDWVYGYILSYGEYIRVIEPENIKQNIIDQLKKSLHNYF